MTPSSKKITGWTAAALGVVGVVVACIQAYGSFVDVRAKARDASEKSVAGFETLNPSVQELQKLADDNAEWARSKEREIKTLKGTNEDLKTRLARLEGFIAAKHGSIPREAPAPPRADEGHMGRPAPPKPPRKPKERTPDDIDMAQRTIFD